MTSARGDQHVALILMMCAIVLWGFNWIVMKYMTSWIGPYDMVFWRNVVAFVVMLAILWSTGQRFHVPPLGPSISIALLQTTGFQCLGQVALQMGGASEVVLLAYTMPFWAAAIAWPVLGERLSRLHGVAFLLAAFGLVMVIAPWKGMGNVQALFPGLLAGLCWGCGVVISKKLFIERPPEMMNFITWQMMLGAVTCLPLVLLLPQPPMVLSVEFFMGMAYMGVLASVAGWWLWLSVVRRLSVAVVGMSSLGVPVLAVLLAWMLLNEQPDAATLTGLAAMVAGLVIVNLASLRPAH